MGGLDGLIPGLAIIPGGPDSLIPGLILDDPASLMPDGLAIPRCLIIIGPPGPLCIICMFIGLVGWGRGCGP